MPRTRITLEGDTGTFHLESCSSGEHAVAAVCLVLPGADCAAERYRWLADALAPLCVETYIIDPPTVARESLLQPGVVTQGQFVGAAHLQAALAWLAEYRPGVRVALAGHSLGGAVILEWLDQDSAKRNPLNEGLEWRFALQDHVIAAVTMGSTLQRHALGITFPWRSDESTLECPWRLPLLMLAGEYDALAPPALVTATARRYCPAASVQTLPGVCHFGWVEGCAPTDRVDLDGKPELSRLEQRARSADAISEFLRPILAAAASAPARRPD